MYAAVYDEELFVQSMNQDDAALERFLEGMANTGRRGTRQALQMVNKLVVMRNGNNRSSNNNNHPDDTTAVPPTAMDLIDTCLRLAVASQALQEPNLDHKATIQQVERLEPVANLMTQSLEAAFEDDAVENEEDNDNNNMQRTTFINWAEQHFPLLATSLSTFVHNLVFHEHAYPQGRIRYMLPKLQQASDVFDGHHDPALTLLSFVSHYFGGNVSGWMEQ